MQDQPTTDRKTSRELFDAVIAAQGYVDRALNKLAGLEPPVIPDAAAFGHATAELLHRHELAWARALAEECRVRFPFDPWARLALGEVAHREARETRDDKKKEAARHYYQEALQLAVGNPAASYRANFELGLSYAYDGEHGTALNYFERALAIRPTASHARDLAARCMMRLGQWEDADATLDRALEDAPLRTLTLTKKAIVGIKLGHYDQAYDAASTIVRRFAMGSQVNPALIADREDEHPAEVDDPRLLGALRLQCCIANFGMRAEQYQATLAGAVHSGIVTGDTEKKLALHRFPTPDPSTFSLEKLETIAGLRSWASRYRSADVQSEGAAREIH